MCALVVPGSDDRPRLRRRSHLKMCPYQLFLQLRYLSQGRTCNDRGAHARSKSSQPAVLLRASSSTVVADVTLAQVSKLKKTSMRTHLFVCLTSESWPIIQSSQGSLLRQPCRACTEETGPSTTGSTSCFRTYLREHGPWPEPPSCPDRPAASAACRRHLN